LHQCPLFYNAQLITQKTDKEGGDEKGAETHKHNQKQIDTQRANLDRVWTTDRYAPAKLVSESKHIKRQLKRHVRPTCFKPAQIGELRLYIRVLIIENFDTCSDHKVVTILGQ
jgi:hypothetical protein